MTSCKLVIGRNEMAKNLTLQVDVFEILRFVLNDNLIGYFTFDTISTPFGLSIPEWDLPVAYRD